MLNYLALVSFVGYRSEKFVFPTLVVLVIGAVYAPPKHAPVMPAHPLGVRRAARRRDGRDGRVGAPGAAELLLLVSRWPASSGGYPPPLARHPGTRTPAARRCVGRGRWRTRAGARRSGHWWHRDARFVQTPSICQKPKSNVFFFFLLRFLYIHGFTTLDLFFKPT